MSSKDDWICRSCKWEGDVREIIKHRVFSATYDEPDEWMWYCPSCKRNDKLEELYENAAWCRTCEDVIVSDEGEQCTECATCESEFAYDKSRGH